MATEIVRELVNGEWVTTVGQGGGGGGGVSEITSTDLSVTITDPTGPTTDLSVQGGLPAAWQEVTVPTDEPSWRGLDNPAGNGNWSFVDGVITFTNEGGAGGGVMMTTVDHFGQAWAVECDMKVGDAMLYQLGFNAAAWIYNAVSGQELNGAGFSANSEAPSIETAVYGGSFPGNDTAILDTEWHTYRAVILPLVQQVYFDGVLVGQTFNPPSAFQSDGLKESRFLLFTNDFTIGDAFRNLKAWRIPMPTFPA